MTALENPQWWGGISKAVRSTALTLAVPPEHVPPRAPVHTALDSLNARETREGGEWISGSPHLGDTDTSQSPSVFSHQPAASLWTGRCLFWAEVLLETNGAPSQTALGWGTPFNGQMLRQVCAVWPVLHFHALTTLNLQV